jgi:hypothetical protein
MTRIRFGSALALLLTAGAAAPAQPGKPPVVQFKQFGGTPEQFFQSSVTRWTSQLALDLEAIKSEVATAKVTPAARAAVNAQAENALARTLELDQLVRRGAGKDKLNAAFADVDRAVAGLTAVLNQNPAAKAAAAPAVGRADTAFHQLAAVLGGGDTDPARLKRRLVRLGDTIDDNADDLRNLVADQIGNDRALDRSLGLFAREARQLARRARDDADPDLVKRAYAAMGERWAESIALLGKLRLLPATVQAQAAKVDALHRRLGAVLNLPPFPGGIDPRLPEAKRLSFAAGAAPGGSPHVVVFGDEKGTVAASFLAYEKGFDGGVRVDMADLNGDGVPELVVAPGPAKGNAVLPVKVFDGRDFHLLVEFVPIPNWKGGLTAAGTDLTKDGRALIAVTADGTQAVKVFDLAQGKEVASFFAHDPKAVTGGVRLAWGDVNADGVPDILTVNGPSNAVTTVKVFSGKNTDVLVEFPVLDNKYKAGAFVAAADFVGNGQANPVVGLDAGTIPVVRVFDGKGKALIDIMAYDEKFRGGVRVGVSARNHVVTGPGPGLKNSPVRVFELARPKTPLAEVAPFPGFDGGLNVGGR